MAVFMINSCVFNRCGKIFPALYELIEHIEDVHIDLDPAVVEQKEASQPAMIPMSYALKFSWTTCVHNLPPAPEVRRRLLSLPRTPSVLSSTPTGSEMDEDEVMSASEDSNDSWTTVEEYSSDFILRYGVKMNPNAVSGALGPAAQEKPFACPVPGCKKRYKNVNGIKYHSKNGHKKDGKVRKAYKCQCGKSYKTAGGLKTHSTVHSGAPPPPAPPGGAARPALAAVVVTAGARNQATAPKGTPPQHIHQVSVPKGSNALQGINQVSIPKVKPGQIVLQGIPVTKASTDATRPQGISTIKPGTGYQTGLQGIPSTKGSTDGTRPLGISNIPVTENPVRLLSGEGLRVYDGDSPRVTVHVQPQPLYDHN